MLGLCCCSGVSLVAARGATLHCSAQNLARQNPILSRCHVQEGTIAESSESHSTFPLSQPLLDDRLCGKTMTEKNKPDCIRDLFLQLYPLHSVACAWSCWL